jgi:hypothetical protein
VPSFKSYARSNVIPAQIGTCSGFQAILLANLRLSRGLVTTGVGAMGCRHELWQPQSVINLQRGERSVLNRPVALTYADRHRSQCNMQMSLFKSLRTMNRGVDVLHSYDINCQFSKNIWDRFDTLPDNIKDVPPPSPDRWTHVIPKVHLKGHVWPCQACYSLNFHHGCARFCGECIERMWALMNGIALSTREMRAG